MNLAHPPLHSANGKIMPLGNLDEGLFALNILLI